MLAAELISMTASEFYLWLALAAMVGIALTWAGMMVAREVAWRRMRARLFADWREEARSNRITGSSEKTGPSTRADELPSWMRKPGDRPDDTLPIRRQSSGRK